jgi:DNA-binding winged helix-turn-helix (wHTH) protein
MAELALPIDRRPRWRCLLLWTSPVSRPLVTALARAGIEVFVTVDAASCLNRLRFAAWDVCIIDSAIPDAKYVKKRVRAEQLGVEVRLIHRFAERPADLADQILAALDRRGAGPTRGSAIAVGDLLIDPTRHDACFAGRALDLPRAEFRLLYLLASHQGPVHRNELALQLGAEFGDTGSRRIDLLVCRVRRKLIEHTGREFIATVRSYGYVFEGEEATQAS